MSAGNAEKAVIAMLCPGGLEHSGGIGRWAGYLQQAWRAQGEDYELRIVDTRGHGGKWVGIVAFPLALVQLVRLWAGRRLALIHANVSIRGSTVRKYAVCVLARWLHVPVVLHLHGSGYDDFFESVPGWLKPRIVAMFQGADVTIVLGDVWRDFLIDEARLPAEKIVKIFNAVAAPSAAPRSDDAADCHIVMLGRLSERKGVPELLTALASDALRGRRWRATLAGDGDVDTYRRMAATLGIASHVSFPGWVDADAAAVLLRGADILALPSYQENLPVSVIEALAYGIAVVTTPVGATPELVEDGVSALFVPAGDSPALGAALAKLIDDPALRRRIGEAGRVVFAQQLDITAAARRFAALYRSILAGRDAATCAADGVAG